MPRAKKSPAAAFVDSLERDARSARPLRRFSVWHASTGLVAGLLLSASFAGSFARPEFTLVVWLLLLITPALFALAGRALWNRLIATEYPVLTASTRSHLLDHELLLLCFADELPSHYEKLRYVAQSYGKTRARNWSELKKGSMHDRLNWLVENYKVICDALKLPRSTSVLNRLTGLAGWMMGLPFALVMLAIFGIVQRWWPPVPTIPLVFGLAAMGMMSGALILSIISHVERCALKAVLVEQLDTDLLLPPETALPAVNLEPSPREAGSGDVLLHQDP